MLGACGDNLVCVKFQTYPHSSAYPHGKCRHHPTKKPKIIEEEGYNTTTVAPTTTETEIPTTTVLPNEEDNNVDVVSFKALTYRQWVMRHFRN